MIAFAHLKEGMWAVNVTQFKPFYLYLLQSNIRQKYLVSHFCIFILHQWPNTLYPIQRTWFRILRWAKACRLLHFIKTTVKEINIEFLSMETGILKLHKKKELKMYYYYWFVDPKGFAVLLTNPFVLFRNGECLHQPYPLRVPKWEFQEGIQINVQNSFYKCLGSQWNLDRIHHSALESTFFLVGNIKTLVMSFIIKLSCGSNKVCKPIIILHEIQIFQQDLIQFNVCKSSIQAWWKINRKQKQKESY